MTLSNLIEKAKTTTKKWWKWFLGVAIALIIFFVLWKLRRQANEIIRLKAKIVEDKEFVKDLEAMAAVEKNSEQAKILYDAAAKLKVDIAAREVQLTKREQEINEAIKRAEAARTWDDLSAQTRGDPH